jgi:hypothetical protein
VVIEQDFSGDEKVDLRSIAGLYGSEYAGAIIDSVDVVMTHQEYGVGLALLTDGVTADVRNSAVDTAHLVPHFGAQLGNDLNTLELEVSGTVHVQQIIINVHHNDYSYRTYSFDQDLILGADDIGTLADQGTLDLTDVINLYEYQGYHVISVNVTAQTTLDQFSVIRFFANDVEQDRALSGTETEDRTFFVTGENQLGYDLSSLKIVADGGLNIQQVEIRLRPDPNIVH